jgi:hypothetical protein
LGLTARDVKAAQLKPDHQTFGRGAREAIDVQQLIRVMLNLAAGSVPSAAGISIPRKQSQLSEAGFQAQLLAVQNEGALDQTVEAVKPEIGFVECIGHGDRRGDMSSHQRSASRQRSNS